MKQLFYLSFVAVLVAACHCNEPAVPEVTGLAGTWKLVDRQCYCVPGPTPSEMVTFTATDFSFYKNGQLTSSGTYTAAAVATCGSQTAMPGIRLTYGGPFQMLPTDVASTITNNKLVLNYGGPCDAPVDTYELVP